MEEKGEFVDVVTTEKEEKGRIDLMLF